MAVCESKLGSSPLHYVLHRGAVRGPFSIDQLIAMRKNGTLDQYTKVSVDRATWQNLDPHLAAVMAADLAPPPIAPPPFTGLQQMGPADLLDPAQVEFLNPLTIRPFPVAALILLHFLTVGIFSFFWVTAVHGRLPKMKSDDPDGFKAVALCFIPFFNIYWFYVVYARLTQRVNAFSIQHRLPAIIPTPFSYVMSTLIVVPILLAMTGLLVLASIFFSPTSKGELFMIFFLLPQILTAVNYLFIAPVYAGLVQASLNRIVTVELRLAIDHSGSR
ncbi:MAG TPA: DUF4234 domain-containing protein [Pirellulales bacterium]|nr:DUF4234 domain-containing protein [Pirellulales bacterium]